MGQRPAAGIGTSALADGFSVRLLGGLMRRVQVETVGDSTRTVVFLLYALAGWVSFGDVCLQFVYSSD